ncbi:Hydroxyacylglutathione_hydrolase [Hexamita inflata]|uniref:Hydroxyacylglutathione hydrolase n=1 Tax=Hexamita inflata TaxID=28002 RepID=A0AA86RAC0_9EUKA|nr:Hydroxyacylglutathione hydrolase [Hexamita inflata]
MPLIIQQFQFFKSFKENCYLAYDSEDKSCVVVDPGEESEKLLNEIIVNKLKLTHILITHAHLDHVFGYYNLKQAFPEAKIMLHENEIPIWNANTKCSTKMILKLIFGVKIHNDYLNIQKYLIKDKQVISIGKYNLEVLCTPGHTHGSVCFLERSEKIAFTGDTIFTDMLGNTKYPDANTQGNQEQLNQSVQLLKKEISGYIIYPGHRNYGDSTQVLQNKTE